MPCPPQNYFSLFLFASRSAQARSKTGHHFKPVLSNENPDFPRRPLTHDPKKSRSSWTRRPSCLSLVLCLSGLFLAGGYCHCFPGTWMSWGREGFTWALPPEQPLREPGRVYPCEEAATATQELPSVCPRGSKVDSCLFPQVALFIAFKRCQAASVRTERAQKGILGKHRSQGGSAQL